MNYITTGSDLTSIANAIRTKGGTTEPLTYPSEFVSAIEAIPTGGEQPTLFAPVITGGVNEISWENNPSNGDFDVNIVATIDEVAVTSPLTITQAMNGKTLIITASAENFESITSTVLLEYMAMGSSLFSVSLSEAYLPSDEGFILWLNNVSDLGDYVLNGETIPASQGCFICVSSGGNTQDTTLTQSFSFVATATASSNSVEIRRRRGKLSPVTLGAVPPAGYITPSSGAWNNSVTFTLVMYDVTAGLEKFSKTYTASSYYNTYQTDTVTLSGDPITAGHTYTFIVNATITALA